MPRPFKKVRRVTVQGDVACPLATETVIATLTGVTTQSPDAVVELDGWAQVLTGAGATASPMIIRRNALGGTIVGEANNVDVVAANRVQYTLSVRDTPGEVAGQTYVLTMTCNGGAGTTLQSSLSAASS